MAVQDLARRAFRGQPKKLKGVLAVPLSFETGEKGDVKVYFPFAVRITKIRSSVAKALAASDAGTITGANATGASAGGVVTHAASAPYADEQSAVPTTNNTVAKDSYYKLTTAKTTAGGKATAFLEYVSI